MSTVTPPSSYVPPQAPATPAPPADGETVQAQVQRLPPSLGSTDRALTLRGEVVAQNQDGSTRIATPRGPVDVRLPDPQPARGTNVDVTLPAGSPPRTATVTLPTQQQPAPAPTPQPQLPVTQTPAPPVQTPAQPLPGQPAPAPQTSLPPGQTQPAAPAPYAGQPSATATPAPAGPVPASPMPSGVTVLQESAQMQNAQLSPQGLLNFLKSSMQSLLRNDAAALAQRPLQIGQLARLTPLPVGQQSVTTPQTATPANAATPQTATPVIIAPQTNTAASALTTTAAQISQPQTPPTQTALQTAVLGNSAAILPATGAPAGANALLTRILTPLGGNPAAPQGAIPGTAGMLLNAPSLNPAMRADMPVLPGQSAITANAGQVQIPAPQTLDVRVGGMMPAMPVNMAQNAGAANLLQGTPTAPVMFATVTGQTVQGLPVVELPTFTTLTNADGMPRAQPALMVLQFPARGLAPATVLQLDILPGTQAAGTAAPAGLPAMDDGVSWDGIDEMLRSLPAQAQAQGIQNALLASLPKPGQAAFSAPVLMFIAALRGGDITAWLGPQTLDMVTRTSRKVDALGKIAADFASTARKFMGEEAKPAGEWRTLQLPMMSNDELSRINLHYRSFERDAEPGETPGKKTGTRFIMDLALTRMGNMQVDGFSIGKKLDVTLRSEQTLSPGMRETMRTRYHNAVAGIGFAGELNFSAGADHKGWIVTEDGPPHHVLSQG